MDNFLVGGAVGTVILDTRRPKKSGLFPVKYRITYQRKQVYYNSGFEVSPKEWEAMPETRAKGLIETRELIKKGFERLEETAKEVVAKEVFSFDAINLRLRKGRKEFITDAYLLKVEDLEANGQTGTASVYRCAMRFISTYDDKAKYTDITPRWLDRFENYATTEGGLVFATLAMYLRTLRTLYNEAIREGVVSEATYPFSKAQNDGRHTIKEGSGTKIALTVQQMVDFIRFQHTTKSMARSKDLFLLSFHFGGINFKDLLLLKWKNLNSRELSYIRAKTARTNQREVTIKIPITEEATEILKRIATPNTNPDGYILPYMIPNATPADVRRIVQNVTRQVNKHLAAIGKGLGIDGLSTYVARHSLATILKNSGASESFIKETLGHSNLSTTQNYLKSFEQQQREEEYGKVSGALNDILKK